MVVQAQMTTREPAQLAVQQRAQMTGRSIAQEQAHLATQKRVGPAIQLAAPLAVLGQAQTAAREPGHWVPRGQKALLAKWQLGVAAGMP